MLKLKKGESQRNKTTKWMNMQNQENEKQPIEYPSAGSTFKRGTDFITAKLIDEAGLKGYYNRRSTSFRKTCRIYNK